MPIYSADQLAKLWNVTVRYINRLVKERGMPRTGRGKYDANECTHWYLDFIKKGADDEHRDLMRREELREARNENELHEINLAKKRGEVVRIDDVEYILTPAFSSIRSNFLGFKKRAVQETGNKELEPLLDTIINDSLNELSNIPDLLRSLAPTPPSSAPANVRDPAAPAKAQSKRVGRSASRTKRRISRRSVGHRKG